MEGEVQLADQCFHVPKLSQYKTPILIRRSALTYRNNRSTSPTIHLVEICSTENAAYPGSAMCLILRISLSSASRRFEKLYGRGVFRYGGNGWRLVILAERRHSTEVISWVVMRAWVMRALKSWIQADSDSSAPSLERASEA